MIPRSFITRRHRQRMPAAWPGWKPATSGEKKKKKDRCDDVKEHENFKKMILGEVAEDEAEDRVSSEGCRRRG